ncbi:MAG: cobalamin-binding protein [Zoogloeaceae bacterium]|jgi:iron complex transport system substrate-binding protein|nr:cobalamin-binding protein [Zoogloeaceae bacterium]
MKFLSRRPVWRALSLLCAALLSGMAGAVTDALTLTDDEGNTIVLAAPARRIISLAPHLTEILYAAGAGERLVGVVSFSDYPEAARALPRVGSYPRLNLEAIVKLQPDLLVAWKNGNDPTQLAKLRALGMRVFVTEPVKLGDVARLLEGFGKLAGSEAVAARAAADFRDRRAALEARYRHRPPVRVFYQIWQAPLMTVGKPQIISQVIRLCGGVNVYDNLDSLAPTVSLESVLAADPEVIVATGMADARPEWLDDWKRWPRLLAVRHDNLFHINPDLIQRHTPRLLNGAEVLCNQLEQARQRRNGR